MKEFSLCIACLLYLAGFASGVTFSVTPSLVSDTYSGLITLQVGGLTNGETVVVQKFLDANTNNLIDAGDWLAQQFRLTDGQATVIGGVTNLNVPGDSNPAASNITAQLNLPTGGILQHMVAKYGFKLSSLTGRFIPVTNFFTVTNFSYSQSFTGSVRSSGVAVPNASVMVFEPMPNFKPVAGTVANNSGNYAIKVPPGTYLLWAFKSNYVADLATAPVLTLTNGTTRGTNLNLLATTRTVSGKFTDAANATVGLPGILVACQSSAGLFATGVSDTNGNYTVRVTASQWQMMWDRANVSTLGYLLPESVPTVNTTSGNAVTNVAFPKGTALIYGNFSDYQGHPMSDVIFGEASSGTYRSDATSDENGNYYMPVIAGDWDLWVDAAYSGYPNHVFLASSSWPYTVADDEALRIDYTGYPVPFVHQATRLPAGRFGFDLIGFGGSDYTVQFSTNLSSTNWSTLLTTNLPYDSAFFIQDNQATNKQRFYRVKVGP